MGEIKESELNELFCERWQLNEVQLYGLYVELKMRIYGGNIMGQIANQMAFELFFKIKEKIKERKEREKWYKRTLKNSNMSNS